MRTSRSSNVEHLKFRDLNVQVSRRPYKRTIGVNVLVTGRIRVSAPVWVPTHQIEKFLLQHEDWIRSNLEQFKALRDQHPPKLYIEGEEFPLIGEMLKLAFAQGVGTEARVNKTDDGCLRVEIPHKDWASFNQDEPHPEFAEIIANFYREVGTETIRLRIEHFAKTMQLFPSEVLFRAQKSRWGSCSTTGRIHMNWRLIVMPIEVINYVIVHELSHLKHYDHSAIFWSFVERVIPNYLKLRSWLKENQFQADFLAKRSELHNS
jgi:predicted metal-dependent hydrolase